MLVLNTRNRPVEVHVGGRVVRIGPLATGEVPRAGDQDSAQLHALVASGALSILGEAPAARPARRRKAVAKKATAKTGAAKKAAATKKTSRRDG